MPRAGRISLNNPTRSTQRTWRAVAELAARQHGVVSLGQLVALGFAPATVRYWVASGRLVRLYRGTFAVGHAVLRPEGHYLAAVLAGGEEAVLSYHSAGAHWGIRPSAASVIDISAPKRTGRCKQGLRVHRGLRVADEVTVEDRVPVTTVARTLLDLAAVLDRRGIERTIETAERRELFDLRALSVLLGRHRGRRGTARLRDVLAQFDPDLLRVRSELEARFLHLCGDRAIPKPIVNGRIEVGAGETLEVDFHWPHAWLVVETDGEAFHRTTAARQRDADRDRLLAQGGWSLIRCGWRDVVVDPDPLVARVKRSLAPTAPPAGAFR